MRYINLLLLTYLLTKEGVAPEWAGRYVGPTFRALEAAGNSYHHHR